MNWRQRQERRERHREKMARMSHARCRQIEAGPAPDYPLPLPNLRRRIIVQDFDFGEREVKIDLYKCRRVDCYTVVIDGEVVNHRAGWSTVLEDLRAMFTRVMAV